jgi:hypothetical protein
MNYPVNDGSPGTQDSEALLNLNEKESAQDAAISVRQTE